MKVLLKSLVGMSLGVSVFCGPASAAIINIKAIAGKTPAEVSKVLGKPGRTEKVRPSGTGCNPCDKLFYKNSKYEIVFIKGKSDWITINDLGSSVPYRPLAITYLDLPFSITTFMNDIVLKWKPKGFYEVSLFSDGSKNADYFYVKVKTK